MSHFELTTLDSPGLLSKVGQVFFDCRVVLHRAKIVTIGEKVEDVFYVTTPGNTLLNPSEQEHVKSSLLSVLSAL